jgi:hypothetical protein
MFGESEFNIMKYFCILAGYQKKQTRAFRQKNLMVGRFNELKEYWLSSSASRFLAVRIDDSMNSIVPDFPTRGVYPAGFTACDGAEDPLKFALGHEV